MKLVASVRQALRRYSRTPGFTAACLLTLALGIGANTAIFSIIEGVLLKPLPFHEPERLVGLWNRAPQLGFDQLNQSAAFYLTYREEAQSFEEVVLWDNTQVSITGRERPERVPAMLVTEGFFPTLGASPTLGRFFNAEDDSPESVETIVVSHDYWTNRLGQDSEVLGTTLNVNGRPREIIGVAPPGFRFLRFEPQIYFPARFDPNETFVGQFNYQMFGRTRSEPDLALLESELTPLIVRATERFPGGLQLEMLEEAGFAPIVTTLKQDAVGDVGRVLWILMGTVGLVLLIACANVANLFLVRAESQRRETALRSALGASLGQIVRFTLLESTVLALAAGALGLVFARLALTGLVRLEPGNLPRLHEVSIGPNVVLFTVVLSIVAGLLFGSFALLRSGRIDLVAALKEGGRGSSGAGPSHRLRHALVVAQVALALVLLVGSGLMIRSFLELRAVEPGFQKAEDVLTFRVTVGSSVEPDSLKVEQLWKQSIEELGALPGVTSVSASSSVTMDGNDSNDPIFVEGFEVAENQIPPVRRFKWAAPGYFETMGNPLIAGRTFEWADIDERRDVVVITRDLALEYWDTPGEAIGKRIRNVFLENTEVPWREIVGVVGEVRDDGPDQEAVDIVYYPFAMANMWGDELRIERSMRFVMRVEGAPPESLMPQVQEVIWSQNSNLPLANVSTLEDIAARQMARTSFTVIMLMIAAGVALLLGSIGIYAVLAYIVSLRTQEIGVRMALGAQRREVIAMIVRHGLALTSVGLVVGGAAALGVSRLMTGLLYGVQTSDPPTYLGVTAVLAAAALAACLLVSARATRLDPISVLRAD